MIADIDDNHRPFAVFRELKQRLLSQSDEQFGAKYEDREWICRTIDGDTESFGFLVRKYQDRLYNGMVQILRNESEAEDVVQDAFVLAFSKLDSFQGKSAFFTWLYRIAYNVAITRLRRRNAAFHSMVVSQAFDWIFQTADLYQITRLKNGKKRFSCMTRLTSYRASTVRFWF